MFFSTRSGLMRFLVGRTFGFGGWVMCSKPLHNAGIFTELMLCQQPRDLLALPTVPHY